MHYAMSICRAATPTRMRSRVLSLLAIAVLAGAGATLLVSGPATGKGSKPVAGLPPAAARRRRSTLHQASALTLALSPDHKTISMNLLGNLWTLPASGGTATRTSSLMQDTAYPDWSPDGKTVAFQSYKSGTFHIWAMNPGREQRARAHLRLLRRPRAAVLPRRDEDRLLLRPAAGGLPRGHRDRVLQRLDADAGHGAADRGHPPVGRGQRLLPDVDPGRQADHLRRHEPRHREHSPPTGRARRRRSTPTPPTPSTRPPGRPTARASPTPSSSTRAR